MTLYNVKSWYRPEADILLAGNLGYVSKTYPRHSEAGPAEAINDWANDQVLDG